MLLIDSIVMQEKDRIEKMISMYKEELKLLPQGTFLIKKIRGKEYLYNQYRDGNRVVSKYIGKNGINNSAKIEGVERRKQIESIIKTLNAELVRVNRFLSGGRI